MVNNPTYVNIATDILIDYLYKAYCPDTDPQITKQFKKGLRGVVRNHSKIQFASRIFIDKKIHPHWLVYVLDRETRKVVTFNVGRLTNRT